MSKPKTAAERLAVEYWPIDRPLPYAANPRKNEGAVSKVAASLKEFGFRQPIVVDKAGVVVAGHTRLMAAKSLGWTEVPVHVADLTPERARAYRLADNRTAQESVWDDALLMDELAGLQLDGFDLSITGFDAAEIDRLVGDVALEAPEPLDPDSSVKSHQCPKCGYHW